MRQAGRMLPSYRTLREKYSFRELMSDPALAAEVTLLPVYELGVDAAILFSDILVVPEALNMKLSFTDNGPVFDAPLKKYDGSSALLNPKPSKLQYIYSAIEMVVKKKPEDIPLIGFCGAPLTIFGYMVEGMGRGNTFSNAVKMIYSNRKEAEKILDMITEMSVEYALNQVKHGIDVFQLFDTHAGIIPFELYMTMIFPRIQRITDAVRRAGVPVIFFPKDLGAGISFITSEMTDVLGVDWQSSIEQVRAAADPQLCLQGNIDPRVLLADTGTIKSYLEPYLNFGRRNNRWIVNLGHGVLPDTPDENVKFVVDWVKNSNWQRG